jgi:hypothetical protein
MNVFLICYRCSQMFEVTYEYTVTLKTAVLVEAVIETDRYMPAHRTGTSFSS